MDDDGVEDIPPHRGGAGDEGHHAERLGHRSVQQYLVRHGDFLRLDTGIPYCQLDVGKKEDELSSLPSSSQINKHYSIVLLSIYQ